MLIRVLGMVALSLPTQRKAKLLEDAANGAIGNFRKSGFKTLFVFFIKILKIDEIKFRCFINFEI